MATHTSSETAHVLFSNAIHLGKNREESKKEGLNVLQQIYEDKGEFVKDRYGRYRIVYEDDNDIDEYRSCIQRVVIDTNCYDEVFKEKVKSLLEGIFEQKKKRYPFSVTKNPNKIKVSKSNQYREGREFRVVQPDEETHLYKHLKENSSVRMVKDYITGFVHICKTTIMAKFRPEEVQAMMMLPGTAPEIYNVNRNEEDVSIHMELIQGTRLDIVANFIRNEHLWPLSLHIFSELLDAINNLSRNDMSHCDIHTKNIIIEITDENKIKIRLIDYGDACFYTIDNLIGDMKSLVASLLALFTRNDFNAYDEDPLEWIEEHPEIWQRNSKLWDLMKGALDVKNVSELQKLINYVSVIMDKARTHSNDLTEIATLIQIGNPVAGLAQLSLQAE